MKYLWASWPNKTSQHLLVGDNANASKTRHIRGYGRAVTFSYSGVAWSGLHATYDRAPRFSEPSISQA